MAEDTIFAPASGAGRAAIAVVRLSGPGTAGVLESMAGRLPAPRRMTLSVLRDPASGEALDQALVVWMPGPHSFTGEDQAELHLHGGLAVRAAVLRTLAGLPGCRAAEPGEFTRRAFLNGRMDLSAVEGLADLIDAETEAQRRQALRQLEGRLGGLVEAWRERLVVGFVVVLAGPPNAGKSTLLNALARRDVAIVSPVAGTTRDAIEVRCDLNGLPVTFVDTAGLRDSADPIEREGVARARAKLGAADLALWLVAADLPGEAAPVGDVPLLRVGTKSDLGGADAQAVDLTVSAATGAGLADLLDRIGREAEAALGTGDAVVTRERHRRALDMAVAALARAEAALADNAFLELAVEDVRL